MRRPAVFLDRDGTLIEEVDYLSRVEDLRLFPFTPQAVRLLKDDNYRLIVITNQSGIGRGIFDEAAMHEIHHRINAELAGAIDRFYFCPHLPDDGCECRKPSIGMIEAACRDMDIDLNRSWMIGDKNLDLVTGKNAGLRTALVRTGYGARHEAILNERPDHIENDLLAAVRRIIEAPSG